MISFFYWARFFLFSDKLPFSKDSVEQAYNTLQSILGHAYDVMKVDATTLQNEPWQENCSLIVIPGGRDSPYCEDLKGATVQKIKAFVNGGGRYLGFCAGAYYASRDIEFEKGTDLEVIAIYFFKGFPQHQFSILNPIYNKYTSHRT